ncbi:hypothetical protein V8B97DRAFT_2104313 [Scleroderma yunnanense]
MDPAKVRRHFHYFRILVIGRSNAGKTTILQRVCNTIEFPEIFNAKGEKRAYRNIEDEPIFRSNPGFIFHDLRGFEGGNFISKRATTMKLEKQIHATRFCIPMTDYKRPILAANKNFFQWIPAVPVIVVLTKADALHLDALEQVMEDEGLTNREAKPRAQEVEIEMLDELKMRIMTQWAGCVHMSVTCLLHKGVNEDHADCNALLRCTTNPLHKVELQKLMTSTQQVNVLLKLNMLPSKGTILMSLYVTW